MRSFIVGGAGFIGSHLSDKLVELGPVTLYDNLSVGKTDFFAEHLRTRAATPVAQDALYTSARTYLEVLGDGNQAKPYLHVTDCVAGILHGFRHAASASQTTPGGTLRDPSEFERALRSARSRVHVFNLAPADWTSVRRIAELCVAASPYPNAEIRFTGGERGWPGDVPQSRIKPDKLAALGFRVRYTSDQAVELAVRALANETIG